MPDRLYFTDSDEANAMIASDPMALLVGFVLDQQVTVQKAFGGPLAIRERIGAFDVDTLATADLEPVFRARPAIHRYPGSMAQRVHDLAVHVRDRYDGDAARVWTDAADSDELRANLAALPGFGEMKVRSLGAVLAKRFGVDAARDLVPPHPRWATSIPLRRSPTTRTPSASTRRSGPRRGRAPSVRGPRILAGAILRRRCPRRTLRSCAEASTRSRRGTRARCSI